jgi:hypothetical protein
MRPQRQTLAVIALGICTVAGLLVLCALMPTVDGQALRSAELTLPLDRVQVPEYARLFTWLRIDVIFAVICTAFLVAALRWLALRSRPLMARVGRLLSWIVAVGILVNFAEIAILWSGASIGASQVPPWLGALQILEWVAPALGVIYALAWTAFRWITPTRPSGTESP